jgi:hypothetical protein
MDYTLSTRNLQTSRRRGRVHRSTARPRVLAFEAAVIAVLRARGLSNSGAFSIRESTMGAGRASILAKWSEGIDPAFRKFVAGFASNWEEVFRTRDR